jgi:FAD dependent oxidoreductase TIGR03364
VGEVVVVGGGIVGLMHAVQARQRGHEVIHLEREAGTRGASVRNFGLIWISGRGGGPELDLALRARQLWEEIAGLIPGTGFRPHGSMTLASNDAELTVLKEAAARPDAADRGYQLLHPDEVAELNPALRGSFAGGLLGGKDAIVEPRLVPEAIRTHLRAAGSGYSWLPGREVIELGDRAVRDHTGAWHSGDLIVLCPGAAHTGLVGSHLAGFASPPVRRVRLQMLQTEPFAGQLTTSVADGDSLRYYPAYDLPGLAALPPQVPVAAAAAAQLLLVQRLNGGLTIGDTHSYAEPFPFDVDEAPYDHLRARAEELLGSRLPPTRLRWAGVYSQVSTADLYHRSQVTDGIVLVTGPGGRGMTCSPAIAEETFRMEAL